LKRKKVRENMASKGSLCEESGEKRKGERSRQRKTPVEEVASANSSAERTARKIAMGLF
jgi:hypothetical protein